MADGSIDLTRAFTITQVLALKEVFYHYFLVKVFEIPDLLIKFIDTIYKSFLSIWNPFFILFYFMIKPAIKHSGRLFLFLLMVFLSKFNISTLPFWLSVYFCEKEYNKKILNKI